MHNIAQELLRCGINPNYLIKIDHTREITDKYTFNKLFYESPVSSLPRELGVVNNSPIPGLPSICPGEWRVKSFSTQRVSTYT